MAWLGKDLQAHLIPSLQWMEPHQGHLQWDRAAGGPPGPHPMHCPPPGLLGAELRPKLIAWMSRRTPPHPSTPLGMCLAASPHSLSCFATAATRLCPLDAPSPLRAFARGAEAAPVQPLVVPEMSPCHHPGDRAGTQQGRTGQGPAPGTAWSDPTRAFTFPGTTNSQNGNKSSVLRLEAPGAGCPSCPRSVPALGGLGVPEGDGLGCSDLPGAAGMPWCEQGGKFQEIFIPSSAFTERIPPPPSW